jgi:hypothetical protein
MFSGTQPSYKRHSIPITGLASKSDDGQLHILVSKNLMCSLANPYTRKLFMLTGMLSVGAEGQVQLVVQWLHHSYKVSHEANETPHRSFLCETFRLPAIVPKYRIVHLMVFSNSRQIVCLFETTQIKQRCLSKRPHARTLHFSSRDGRVKIRRRLVHGTDTHHLSAPCHFHFFLL